MNAFFLKSLRPYFNFPGLSLPGALNSGLWLDEKIDALQHNVAVEVADYLERYPQTKHVDVYLNDINGTMRGKRLSVESMLSLEKGCYLMRWSLPPSQYYAEDRLSFGEPSW
ncbi:glutamine synthetase, partial [Enterobacter roggenkampii]|nr:glutamine synthetase [Enterobacter roggenkampii]